jgi:hypothetical protein
VECGVATPYLGVTVWLSGREPIIELGEIGSVSWTWSLWIISDSNILFMDSIGQEYESNIVLESVGNE